MLKSKDGAYTSDPVEVDSILAQAWDPVFNHEGGEEPITRLDAYLAQAGRGIYHGEEFGLLGWGEDEFLTLLARGAGQGRGLGRLGSQALACALP